MSSANLNDIPAPLNLKYKVNGPGKAGKPVCINSHRTPIAPKFSNMKAKGDDVKIVTSDDSSSDEDISTMANAGDQVYASSLADNPSIFDFDEDRFRFEVETLQSEVAGLAKNLKVALRRVMKVERKEKEFEYNTTVFLSEVMSRVDIKVRRELLTAVGTAAIELKVPDPIAKSLTDNLRVTWTDGFPKAGNFYGVGRCSGGGTSGLRGGGNSDKPKNLTGSGFCVLM